ncbi:MAG: hypothetical protein AAAFM81_00185 [Pseudomonadota bacterium]
MLRKLVLLAVLSLPSFASAEVNAETGLIVDEHWQLVAGMCSSCHSLKIVTAQRGDRVYWEKTIRWMQKTQNLWVIPPEIENKILDYLSKNYADEAAGRRPALPPALMPGKDSRQVND